MDTKSLAVDLACAYVGCQKPRSRTSMSDNMHDIAEVIKNCMK